MCPRDGVDDRETEPDAAVSPASGRVRAAKAFPDVRERVRRDAAAGIDDLDHDVVPVRMGPELDGVSVVGVLDGVLEQCVERTAQTLGVDGDAPSGELAELPGPGSHLRPAHEDVLEERLELDIDLRLTDLWREAGEITEWNLDVVAAFMRAAYGKGYCDALTEDSPGSLCHDHGYRIPGRRPAPAREA